MSEEKIILLDQNTANQIAAGEVVERPASVAKELMENSLDAGAQSIEIEIAEGGIKYLRVTDDGGGMPPADARLCVARHATSKIKNSDDLLAVTTLGFRGEALPSIASVSRFTLLTRTPGSDMATKVTLVGGENEEVLEIGGRVGTSVIVEELFFNVPARRKFLRTDNTEGRYINEVVGKLALTRPDVKFVLTNNGRQVVNTPGSGDLADTVAELYGFKNREDLLPVEHQADNIKVSGYIGKPSLLKSSRQWQTIIVNGRVIQSRFIARALDHAYQSQLPKSGYPFAVLVIELSGSAIDVNVHPQKSEVRFSDEQSVYRVVYRAVSSALEKPLQTPKMEAAPVLPPPAAYTFDFAEEKKPSADSSYTYKIPQRPFAVREESAVYNGRKIDIEPFAAARESIAAEKNAVNTAGDIEKAAQALPQQGVVDAIWPLGQIDRTYIVAQSDDCLYVLDQHAAHERIMYDRLAAGKECVPAQQLLVALFVEMTPGDVDLAVQYKEAFADLCFEFEEAGPDVLRLTSIPADIDSKEVESFIREALRLIVEMKKPSAAELRHDLIAMASCKAAIKAGQTLNMREMKQLIADLFKTSHPFTCPHGRPVIIDFPSGELFRLFKRT